MLEHYVIPGLLYYSAFTIILQIFLSVFIVPTIVPRKWRLLGFEARLDDGEDIAVFTLCTFFLILSPITVWFVFLWIIGSVREYNSIKSVPSEVLEELKSFYAGNCLALSSAVTYYVKYGKILRKRKTSMGEWLDVVEGTQFLTDENGREWLPEGEEVKMETHLE